MKFSHMSLVLVFLLHGLGGCIGSQDAAKLTVNLCKLIGHSLGYGHTGCQVFKRGAKLYIPSTLNIYLILWHTQLIVCAENIQSWVFPFTFQAYILPHTLMQFYDSRPHFWL